ncbi:hypothetical protein N7448_007397 [Penicillium atrosanguineum]|nr:hypothetical protein N7448_007397 [Penicillium atrosanguineum]
MRVRIAKAVTVARNTIDAPPARSTRESTYYTNYLDTLDELSADGEALMDKAMLDHGGPPGSHRPRQACET